MIDALLGLTDVAPPSPIWFLDLQTTLPVVRSVSETTDFASAVVFAIRFAVNIMKVFEKKGKTKSPLGKDQVIMILSLGLTLFISVDTLFAHKKKKKYLYHSPTYLPHDNSYEAYDYNDHFPTYYALPYEEEMQGHYDFNSMMKNYENHDVNWGENTFYESGGRQEQHQTGFKSHFIDATKNGHKETNSHFQAIQSRMKRDNPDFEKIFPNNNHDTSYQGEIKIGSSRSIIDDQTSVYTQMTSMMAASGINGDSCLKYTICRLAHRESQRLSKGKKKDGKDLVADIMAALLLPKEGQTLEKFVSAAETEECGQQYQDCSPTISTVVDAIIDKHKKIRPSKAVEDENL